MKKIFTLIAAVAMAASVNAQTETVIIPEVVLSGDEKSVDYTGDKTLSTENSQIVLGADTEKFTAKPGVLNSELPYVSCISGANNPKDADGKGYSVDTKNLPTTGCYYVFTPKKDGKVEIGIQLSNGKAFYVVDGETGENSVEKTLIVSKDGSTATLDADQKVATKFYGTVNFQVSANKSYYVFCAGSKLGFYGYQFTPGSTTGISSLNAISSAKSTATYNLAGQQVSDSYKGIVIKNGKKYVK